MFLWWVLMMSGISLVHLLVKTVGTGHDPAALGHFKMVTQGHAMVRDTALSLVECLAVVDSNNGSVHLWDHVAVVAHDDVGLLGVADPHVRVEHVAGVLSAVEEGSVGLEDPTRGPEGADRLQTFLNLGHT